MKNFDGKMRLNQLRMFVAVADAGSFSGAAARLDCTQSRISHAIAELENDLGARLLVRSRSGSVPTDAGHRVLAQARQMLRLEDSLFEAVRDGRELAGQVRIACFRSVGTHLLPYALEALAHEYPNIRVDIDDGCYERTDVTEALRQGRADIGIAQLPVEEEFVTQPYVQDSYVLVVPASMKLDPAAGWDQLNRLPFIELACSGAAAVLARCRAAGFAAQANRSLSNHSSISALVGRGMGYSILPRLSTFPEPDEVRILPLPIPARRQLVVAHLADTMRQQVAKTVVRFIRDRQVVAKTKAYRAGIVGWE
ncbi:LysR family transcriptional regulator [Massilia horti]|uniref:LysR family transcriptional regulator n=1 Tax=Massilia horti TaxID=2562153 RepID=A0A4Y9T7P6_9BURK|nr:LysR family transcriptional regulator [Massilia horti]TFW33490.1 LysR family transcriptional regulator [Massilia horti]